MSKRRSVEFSLEEIEGMEYSCLLEKFNFMNDEDAVDSEACAESDGDDGFPLLSNPRPSTSKTRSSGSSSEGTPSVSPASSGVSTPQTQCSDEEDIEDEPIPASLFQTNMEEETVVSEGSEDSEKEDFCWIKSDGGRIKNKFQKINFDQAFGPQVPIDIINVKNIFFLFFDQILMNSILGETVLYASQLGHNLSISIRELNAFMGILILMGLNQLPSIKLYWSSNRHFRNNRIVEIMGQKRFLQILRMLHLNDNSKMPNIGEPEFDKLYKLRPLMDHLKKKFREVFNPCRYLSVDESMIPFKGRSSLKQYVPMKPIKRGFKIFVMCCAVTGYMVVFDFYSGKNSSLGSEERKGPLGERILLFLTKGFENFGYCLFFDRFFSSIMVAYKLLKKVFFSCATIMQTRKLFPKDKLKTDKELKYGESDFAVTQKSFIGVSKWKDRGAKSVCVVSSQDYPSETVEVTRGTKTGKKLKVPCPKPITEYNKYMGGVDKFDQYMAYYSIQWKFRRWWVKGFYYFVDAAIVNSYILYKEEMKKQKKKPISHLSFRSQLAEELIDGWTSRKIIIPKVLVTRKKFGTQTEKRVTKTEGHLPVKGSIQRCALCSTKKKPKRSTLMCKECNVALCKFPCFNDFHEQMSSKNN